MAALILDGVLAYVFYHLLKAPTAAGAALLDQIDGFKLFLETAEKDRLEMLHPPSVTPEVFEKFLPYAIALDAENQWSKKFEAEAAAGPRPAPAPLLMPIPRFGIRGAISGSLGTTGFVSSLGSSIGGAVASGLGGTGIELGQWGRRLLRWWRGRRRWRRLVGSGSRSFC